MQKDPEETIRELFGCWERLDLDALLSYIADDCVFRPEPNADPIIGRNAIAAEWGKYIEMTRSFDCEILTMATNGNIVFCERVEAFVLSRGDKLRVPLVGIWEFDENGKIKATRDYYDTAAAQTVEGA